MIGTSTRMSDDESSVKIRCSSHPDYVAPALSALLPVLALPDAPALQPGLDLQVSDPQGEVCEVSSLSWDSADFVDCQASQEGTNRPRRRSPQAEGTVRMEMEEWPSGVDSVVLTSVVQAGTHTSVGILLVGMPYEYG